MKNVTLFSLSSNISGVHFVTFAGFFFFFLSESFTSSSIIDLESVILSRIQEETEDHSEIIFKSDKFNQDLFYMERVLMENIFQPKLAAYRQLPILLGT